VGGGEGEGEGEGEGGGGSLSRGGKVRGDFGGVESEV